MHTPSTRILSALAYDCGIEDYDPTDPLCLELVDALSLAEHARRSSESPDGSSARGMRARERRARKQVPAWFSAEDLIAAPWETAEQRFA